MLHAYFVLKKRLQRIQEKNLALQKLLCERFPLVDRQLDADGGPLLVVTSPRGHRPHTQPMASPRSQPHSQSQSQPFATQLYTLCTKSSRVHLQRHGVLVHSGEKADHVYIVASGECKALRESAVRLEDDDPFSGDYCHLTRGDTIGWHELATAVSNHLQAQKETVMLAKLALRAKEQQWQAMKMEAANDRHTFLKKGKNQLREHQRQVKQDHALQQSQSSPSTSQSHSVRPKTAALPKPGTHSDTVIALTSSIVYSLPFAALLEFLSNHSDITNSLRKILDSLHEYRHQQWTIAEDHRRKRLVELNSEACVHGLQQRAVHGASHFRAVIHPSKHSFPSYHSLAQLQRANEKQRRDVWRREEEKKKKIEETMMALTKSSQSMNVNINDDGAANTVGSDLRSREEQDLYLERVRQDAEKMHEAIKKKHLLSMFKAEEKKAAEANRRASLLLLGSDEKEPICIEISMQSSIAKTVEKSDKELSRSQSCSQSQTSLPPPVRIVLPPLRLDLLPPPSPVSDTQSLDDDDGDEGIYHSPVTPMNFSTLLVVTPSNTSQRSGPVSPFHFATLTPLDSTSASPLSASPADLRYFFAESPSQAPRTPPQPHLSPVNAGVVRPKTTAAALALNITTLEAAQPVASTRTSSMTVVPVTDFEPQSVIVTKSSIADTSLNRAIVPRAPALSVNASSLLPPLTLPQSIVHFNDRTMQQQCQAWLDDASRPSLFAQALTITNMQSKSGKSRFDYDRKFRKKQPIVQHSSLPSLLSSPIPPSKSLSLSLSQSRSLSTIELSMIGAMRAEIDKKQSRKHRLQSRIHTAIVDRLAGECKEQTSAGALNGADIRTDTVAGIEAKDSEAWLSTVDSDSDWFNFVNLKPHTHSAGDVPWQFTTLATDDDSEAVTNRTGVSSSQSQSRASSVAAIAPNSMYTRSDIASIQID